MAVHNLEHIFAALIGLKLKQSLSGELSIQIYHVGGRDGEDKSIFATMSLILARVCLLKPNYIKSAALTVLVLLDWTYPEIAIVTVPRFPPKPRWREEDLFRNEAC